MDGSTWNLSCLSEVNSSNFSGDVSCPAGCTLKAEFSNAGPSDSVTYLESNRLKFVAVPEKATARVLHVAVTSLTGSKVPMTFDLQIDGAPAVPDKVYFTSNGTTIAATEMPFNLQP